MRYQKDMLVYGLVVGGIIGGVLTYFLKPRFEEIDYDEEWEHHERQHPHYKKKHKTMVRV